MTASLLVAAATAPAASGATILQNTAGNAGILTQFYGQSFTTPGGGPWSNVTFNFFSDIPATTPTAAGTAFLLTQEYLGTPAGLSTSVAGFLAESTGISNGHYNFASSVVLQPSTQYFLYENVALAASGGNSISGGAGYFSAGGNFATSSVAGGPGLQSTNFLLAGTLQSPAVPEPASITSSLVGLMCLLGWRRLRRGIDG